MGGTVTATHTVPDDPADPEAAALNVACPICGVQTGEPCQDNVRGFILSVKQPHLYRIHVVGHKGGAQTPFPPPRTPNRIASLGTSRASGCSVHVAATRHLLDSLYRGE